MWRLFCHYLFIIILSFGTSRVSRFVIVAFPGFFFFFAYIFQTSKNR